MNQIDRMRRKILIIFIVFGLIILLMFTVYYYVVIQKSVFDHIDQSTKAVNNSGKIHKIVETYQFYEENGYHIFEGTNKKNKEIFLFVPVDSIDKEKTWHTVKKENITLVDEVTNSLTSSCEDCKLHYVNPAMIDDVPLWEVVYSDERNNYVMEYIKMEDGKQFERLRFRQNE